MVTLTGFEAHDITYPTSRTQDSSDAMNPNPDYAAAYLLVQLTTAPRGTGMCSGEVPETNWDKHER